MAPTNGTTGKLAKGDGRRPSLRPVVPVLPINYPQRPQHKASAAPVKTAASTSDPSPPSLPTPEAAPDNRREKEPIKGEQEQKEETSAKDRQVQNAETLEVSTILGPSSVPTAVAASAAPHAETTTVAAASPPKAAAKANGIGMCIVLPFSQLH
jgi:hypothetical protein